MEKMREEFEAFYSKEFGFREDNPESMFETFCDDGESHEYYRLGVRAAWTTWQAGWEKSRAAQCVELPKAYFVDELVHLVLLILSKKHSTPPVSATSERMTRQS